MQPSIRRALREALTDFYFNSWRLAPANVLWTAALVALLVVAAAFPPAVLLAGALAVPLAGIARMAALIARGEPVAFSDFLGAMRQFGPSALGVGTVVTVIAVVLLTNVALGFESGGLLGWFIGITALYGLAGLAIFLVAFWPVFVDPNHEGTSLRRRVALAGVVVLGSPLRGMGLAVVVVVLLAISVVLFAAIVLVSVAYTNLVAARVVLPTLDGLETRVPESRLPG